MQQKEEDKGQCDLFEIILGINHKEFKEAFWSCIRPSANPSIYLNQWNPWLVKLEMQ